MLSSLILSFAMSTTPAANVDTFTIEETGTKRTQVRINTQELTVKEVGTKRTQVRI